MQAQRLQSSLLSVLLEVRQSGTWCIDLMWWGGSGGWWERGGDWGGYVSQRGVFQGVWKVMSVVDWGVRIPSGGEI